QVPGFSQAPEAGLQTKPFGCRLFAEQLALAPEQVPGASHGPLAGLQTVPAEASASGGQVVVVPLQVSAVSHGPGEARPPVPGVSGIAGHSPDEPVQVAFVLQAPPAQGVEASAKPQVGVQHLVPSHDSPASTTALPQAGPFRLAIS